MKGQTTLEMAVLSVTVAAGLLGMSIYVKRAVAGRLRLTADQAGEQFSTRTFTSATEVAFNSSRRELLLPDGTNQSRITGEDGETQSRLSIEPERVGGFADETLF